MVQASGFPLLERAMPGLAVSANVHPVFVHFPVALWPAALLFWVLALVRSHDALFATARWLTYLALLGSVAAAATGIVAEVTLGHDSPGHNLVHVHKYFMITTTAFGLVTAIIAFVTASRPARPWRFAWGTGLVVTVTIMTFGADRGALLVYGHGVGTALTTSSSDTRPGTPSETKADDGHQH